jgi:DNA-binding NarL/FixJ family response regulator
MAFGRSEVCGILGFTQADPDVAWRSGSMQSPVTHKVRLLIADRRPIAASGLAAAFEHTTDVVVERSCHEVGELSTVLGCGRTIDAVVIDAEMFEGDASRAVAAVRLLDPGVAVLLLTTRVDASLLKAIGHGYISCVSAYSDGQTIVSALRALIGGQTHLPSDVQRALTAMLRQPAPSPAERLTSREEQVLELAATGLTISQIAARLYISHSTAKTHLLRVYEKLEAPNRSAAVAIALARGMLRVSTAAG